MVASNELIQLGPTAFIPKIKAMAVNTHDCTSDAVQLAFFKQSLFKGTHAAQIALKHIECVSLGEYLEVELEGRQQGKERRPHVDVFVGEVPDGVFVEGLSIFILFLNHSEIAESVGSNDYESVSVT